MSVQITDDGKQLKIVSGTNTTRVDKDGLRISVDGDYIFIGSLKYKYDEVTVPSESSAAALAATLDGYLDNEGLFPFGADYFSATDADENGNYQTYTYKRGGSGGTVLKTVTYTYDASNKVTSGSIA